MIGVLLAMFLVLPVAAKINYKKWLQEEVVWVISQKERARFLALKTDGEREAFIQEFWERRDPTPSTPRNEYKEEHYRRFEHALKTFQEGVPGWRTDRGRVYIVHGRPDREFFISSQARLSLGPMSDSQSRMPNTIIWSYHGNPNGKYYRGELNLIFQPSAGLTKQDFALDESATGQQRAEDLARLFGPAADQNWLEGDMRYRLITAGPPSMVNTRGAEMPTTGIGEAAKYLDDIFRSPGDALEENLEKRDRMEQAKRQMREAVTAQLSFGNLPLSLSTRSAVSLSEVLITNRIQASGGQGQTPSDSGLTLGDTRLLPNPARQFLPSDSLFLYFQVYLPQGRELKETDLSVAIHFMKDNEIVNRLEPRKITDTQSTIPGVVNFATAVPLNGLAPGEYTLQVQAIDHTARKFAFQRTSFTVLDR